MISLFFLNPSSVFMKNAGTAWWGCTEQERKRLSSRAVYLLLLAAEVGC